MSRRGNCHDNAVAESFFQLLKRQRIKKTIYVTQEEARSNIFDYIEMFFNSKRRHSSSAQMPLMEVKINIINGSEVSRLTLVIQFLGIATGVFLCQGISINMDLGENFLLLPPHQNQMLSLRVGPEFRLFTHIDFADVFFKYFYFLIGIQVPVQSYG